MLCRRAVSLRARRGAHDGIVRAPHRLRATGPSACAGGPGLAGGGGGAPPRSRSGVDAARGVSCHPARIAHRFGWCCACRGAGMARRRRGRGAKRSPGGARPPGPAGWRRAAAAPVLRLAVVVSVRPRGRRVARPHLSGCARERVGVDRPHRLAPRVRLLRPAVARVRASSAALPRRGDPASLASPARRAAAAGAGRGPCGGRGASRRSRGQPGGGCPTLR